MWQKNGEIELWEADCVKIDPANRKVRCLPVFKDDPEAIQEFSLEYDYLIIAVGAQVNTFDTPGVSENCHFLKVSVMVSTVNYIILPVSYFNTSKHFRK